MAKQKGIFRIEGTVGGVTFYQRGGVDLVKEVSSVKRERIMNDPDFQRTRENMAEFGGSATVGKALRMGLTSLMRTMGDRNSSARITSLMKKVNNLGLGDRGQRGFEILAHAQTLLGFEFNKTTIFSSVFNAPFTFTSVPARDQTTLTVPDFNTLDYLTPPLGATHFRFVNAAVILSDHQYDPTIRKYAPSEPLLNSLSDVQYSAHIPLGGMVGATTTVIATVNTPTAMVPTAALIGCVGVEFFQEVNSQFYLLAGKNCMQIKEVF